MPLRKCCVSLTPICEYLGIPLPSPHSRRHSVLVLDELDHIAASFQSLVSLLSLPQLASSSVRIIGIANTHTLTSSLSQFSTSMRTVSGVKTLHFAPYTPTQLSEILRTRLGTIDEEKKFLPAPTLMLLTKKVAAMTGDVRALFEVLRGAIDLAVASNAKKHADPMDSQPPVVMPPHVLAALKAYAPASTTATRSSAVTSNSESVVKVRNLGLQSQLVFLAVLLASKRLEASLSLSLSSSPLKRSLSASVGERQRECAGNGCGNIARLLWVHFEQGWE
jgi:cell division control protein 6